MKAPIDLADDIANLVRSRLERQDGGRYTLDEVDVTNRPREGLVIVRLEFQRDFPDEHTDL